MRLRIVQLKCRPGLFERALEHGGRVSEAGDFIYIDDEKGAELLRSPVEFKQPDNMPLQDKVELGLCGKHRETWVSAGRPMRDESKVAELKAVCESCEHTVNGKMLCRKWACCHAGRRAATWDCPINRWSV